MAAAGPAPPSSTSAAGRPPRTLPLAPLPPAIVLAVGVVMAIALVLLGVSELRRSSHAEARGRAAALSAVLSARVRALPAAERALVLDRSSAETGASVWVVSRDGELRSAHGAAAPSPTALRALLDGEPESSEGRRAIARAALDGGEGPLSLFSVVETPWVPGTQSGLARTVAGITAVLLGFAIVVSLAFVRSARDDVAFLGQRVLAMARADVEHPAGEPVPIRTLDQVGALTSAFDLLVERFGAAERAYRADLTQAAAIDAELSEFLAGLSHELRTPLNAILGFSHLLETGIDGPLPDEALEYLAIVRTSGEHLRQLVDDVLDLSALEGGQLVLSLRDADVRAIVDEVIAEAGPAAAAKGLELFATGDDLAVAHIDKRRIRQVVQNLVQNAIKFTTRGSVRVSVRALDGSVELRVIDTGQGIAAGERATIFQEYRQAGPEQHRRAGVGLGLAIVRRIVALHRGKIYLGSEIGRGSTFVIRLPGPRQPSADAPRAEGGS